MSGDYTSLSSITSYAQSLFFLTNSKFLLFPVWFFNLITFCSLSEANVLQLMPLLPSACMQQYMQDNIVICL
jgi:hypothetical protein